MLDTETQKSSPDMLTSAPVVLLPMDFKGRTTASEKKINITDKTGSVGVLV